MDQVEYTFEQANQSQFWPDRQCGVISANLEECWHAVYTLPRHEKSLARQLALRNVEYFLPVYSAHRKWSDGSKVTLELPLFPGYIFVRVSRTTRLRVLESPGALYIIEGLGKQPAEIPSAQIDTLRNGLAKDRSQPHPLLTVGQRVRIIRGALTGMQGILQRLKTGCRVVITLELIMRSVGVEIDINDLEMIH